jgi:hypothetical protein
MECKVMGGGRGLDSSGSGYNEAADSCAKDNEPKVY